MRSNRRRQGEPSHIVSAWSREDGFCLGQKAVSEKSNEIMAIPELLDKIQIKGQVITIDAIGAQKTIAEKIRNKWAGYVLALNGNQTGLYEDAKLHFCDRETLEGIRGKGNYVSTAEKAHGQVLPVRKILYCAYLSWKGLILLGICRAKRNGFGLIVLAESLLIKRDAGKPNALYIGQVLFIMVFAFIYYFLE